MVVDALKINWLDTNYGVAGIPITDLARLAQAEGLRYFGFRHEQSASYAAGIYLADNSEASNLQFPSSQWNPHETWAPGP